MERTSENQPPTARDWIRVYPNPAKGGTVVQLIVSDKTTFTHGTITIYDMSGKQVLFKKIANENDLKIRIGNWAKGIYLVNINYDNKNKAERLVIE